MMATTTSAPVRMVLILLTFMGGNDSLKAGVAPIFEVGPGGDDDRAPLFLEAAEFTNEFRGIGPVRGRFSNPFG